MGGERFRPKRAAIRANLSTREQITREIRGVRCVRGRVQIRAVSQQLHVSWCIYIGHVAAAHEQRTVSYFLYLIIYRKIDFLIKNKYYKQLKIDSIKMCKYLYINIIVALILL